MLILLIEIRGCLPTPDLLHIIDSPVKVVEDVDCIRNYISVEC
jgi:hypothetical protein